MEWVNLDDPHAVFPSPRERAVFVYSRTNNGIWIPTGDPGEKEKEGRTCWWTELLDEERRYPMEDEFAGHPQTSFPREAVAEQSRGSEDWPELVEGHQRQLTDGPAGSSVSCR